MSRALSLAAVALAAVASLGPPTAQAAGLSGQFEGVVSSMSVYGGAAPPAGVAPGTRAEGCFRYRVAEVRSARPGTVDSSRTYVFAGGARESFFSIGIGGLVWTSGARFSVSIGDDSRIITPKGMHDQIVFYRAGSPDGAFAAHPGALGRDSAGLNIGLSGGEPGPGLVASTMLPEGPDQIDLAGARGHASIHSTDPQRPGTWWSIRVTIDMASLILAPADHSGTADPAEGCPPPALSARAQGKAGT